jgi:hypothetical protein
MSVKHAQFTSGFTANQHGFDVLTAMIMKSSVFWDVTSRSPLKINGLFAEICRHIQN